MNWQGLTLLLALAGAFAAAMAAPPAQAQNYTFKVLHTFHEKDGADPVSVLARDEAGNLFGTTTAGGSGRNCSGGGFTCGAAFKMDSAGKEVWLHSFFNGAGGHGPGEGLLRDAKGRLFGATASGGDTNCFPPYGCGVVFKMSAKTGRETVLHKFTGFPDGPGANLLVEDAAGNLYGMSPMGGANALGDVFRMDSTGMETILYSFTGGSDGCDAGPGVTMDSAGNLYGVTFMGGAGFCNSGYGVVFKVDTAGNETVLHTFGGGDGANPYSVLLFDSNGNLYGLTANGGSSQCGGTGCGTVFELSPQSGGGWKETVLYAFCSLTGCADGESPNTSLVMDGAGNLYGNTYFGGAYRNCNGEGCGVVFKLDTTGNETVLHSFTGGSDGAFPGAGLVADSHGALYGTTQQGGAKCYRSYTCGVVFKVSP